MSDRVAVFDRGRIEQLATPRGAVHAAAHRVRRALRRRRQRVRGRAGSNDWRAPRGLCDAARNDARATHGRRRAGRARRLRGRRVLDVQYHGATSRWQVALTMARPSRWSDRSPLQPGQLRDGGKVYVPGPPPDGGTGRCVIGPRRRRRDGAADMTSAAVATGTAASSGAQSLTFFYRRCTCYLLLLLCRRCCGSAPCTWARCSRCWRRASTPSTNSPRPIVREPTLATYRQLLHAARQPRHRPAHAGDGGGGDGRERHHRVPDRELHGALRARPRMKALFYMSA